MSLRSKPVRGHASRFAPMAMAILVVSCSGGSKDGATPYLADEAGVPASSSVGELSMLRYGALGAGGAACWRSLPLATSVLTSTSSLMVRLPSCHVDADKTISTVPPPWQLDSSKARFPFGKTAPPPRAPRDSLPSRRLSRDSSSLPPQRFPEVAVP
jgi:hypothetical protein